MPTEIPMLTPPPEVPLRADRATFPLRAENWTLWEKNFHYTQIVAYGEAVYQNAIEAATATESAAIAVGAANYKGDYSAMVTYLQGESVSYLGERYIAKKTNLGITPVEGTDWLLLVRPRTEDFLLINSGVI